MCSARSLDSVVAAGTLITILGLSALPVHASEQTLSIALGKPIADRDIVGIDLSVAPNGDNLPTGSGTPDQGKVIFASQCSSCHGSEGSGGEGLVEPLVGGIGSLDSASPVKTVGSFWPYASTLFDYTRRAMPLNAPLSLSDNQVYAVTAYLLSLNGIITSDTVLNATTLATIEMPNLGGFISHWPDHTHDGE